MQVFLCFCILGWALFPGGRQGLGRSVSIQKPLGFSRELGMGLKKDKWKEERLQNWAGTLSSSLLYTGEGSTGNFSIGSQTHCIFTSTRSKWIGFPRCLQLWDHGISLSLLRQGRQGYHLLSLTTTEVTQMLNYQKEHCLVYFGHVSFHNFALSLLRSCHIFCYF